jgi:hypothetical protein
MKMNNTCLFAGDSPIKKSASGYSLTLDALTELCDRSVMLADSNDNENMPDCVRTATTPV